MENYALRFPRSPLLVTWYVLLIRFDIPVLDETGVMVNDGGDLPDDDQEEREPWYAENQTNCKKRKVNVAPRDIGAHLHIERGVTM